MGTYTRAAYEQLEEEVARLKADFDQAQSLLGAAADDGNNTWHDNPAFEEAMTKIDQARTRWQSALAKLDNAVVVEQTSNGTVVVGSNVLIQYVGDDEAELVHISGEHAVHSDDDEIQQVSTSSRLGNALLGASAGDTVGFSSPSGAPIKVKVHEVE